MTDFSDAALLKGQFATMLAEPPKEADWKKVSCNNGSEEAAQAIAKQIFGFRKSIDPTKDKLEVIAFSALGPIRVMGISPMDGDMMRIDGIRADTQTPAILIQHVEQLSLTFVTAKVQSSNPTERPDDDDGMNIGYVIFDELKERKDARDSSKSKKPSAKKSRGKS